MHFNPQGLLVISSCGVNMNKADISDAAGIMVRLASDIEALGRTVKCIADLCNDPVVLEKALKVTANAVSYIQEHGRNSLTDESGINFVDAVISNGLAGMRVIHDKCWDTSDYCTSKTTPSVAFDLGEYGRILEKVGTTMGCLITKHGSAALPAILKIFSKYIDREAHGMASTALGILLPNGISIADELQIVFEDCANDIRSFIKCP